VHFVGVWCITNLNVSFSKQKQPQAFSLFSQIVTPANRMCLILKCCHIHTTDQGWSIYGKLAQTGM